MIRTHERMFSRDRLWVLVETHEGRIHPFEFIWASDDDGDEPSAWHAYFQPDLDGPGWHVGFAMQHGPHDLVRAAIKMALAADKEKE